jgi:hypothetical protein
LTPHSLTKLTLMIVICLGCSPRIHAQNDRKAELQLRTVHGVVVDKDETAAPTSVVYLLNVKTQAVRTYIADPSGAYRFSGLDPNVDYEVYAEHDDLMSPMHTISSLNSQRDIAITLKLSRKKSR